jgi:hypothetical protein
MMKIAMKYMCNQFMGPGLSPIFLTDPNLAEHYCVALLQTMHDKHGIQNCINIPVLVQEATNPVLRFQVDQETHAFPDMTFSKFREILCRNLEKNKEDTRANILACGFACPVVIAELLRLAGGELKQMVKARSDWSRDIHVAAFWGDYKMKFPALAESLILNFGGVPLSGTPAECMFSEASRQCGFANTTEGEVSHNFSYAGNVRGKLSRQLKSNRRRAGIKTAKKPFRNSKDLCNYLLSLVSISKDFVLCNRQTKRGTKVKRIRKINYKAYRKENARNRKKLVTAYTMHREIREHNQGVINGETARPVRVADPPSELDVMMKMSVPEIKKVLIAAYPDQTRDIKVSNLKKIPAAACEGYLTLQARLKSLLRARASAGSRIVNVEQAHNAGDSEGDDDGDDEAEEDDDQDSDEEEEEEEDEEEDDSDNSDDLDVE